MLHIVALFNILQVLSYPYFHHRTSPLKNFDEWQNCCFLIYTYSTERGLHILCVCILKNKVNVNRYSSAYSLIVSACSSSRNSSTHVE